MVGVAPSAPPHYLSNKKIGAPHDMCWCICVFIVTLLIVF